MKNENATAKKSIAKTTAAPKAKATKKAQPTTKAKATKKTTAQPATTTGPRATSKQAKLIEMLRRPKGAGLAEIMKAFGWQQHTTRAIMSQGGSLKKKHGIDVISERVGEERVYRIAR